MRILTEVLALLKTPFHSRQEFMYREMEELSAKLPNLRLMTTRYSTIWGGASLLTMLLSAMKVRGYISYNMFTVMIMGSGAA